MVIAKNNLSLCKLINSRISQSSQKRITFAEYMDLVLYHPQQGYYATGIANIGAQGDFFTSPHLGVDFGELLAEQFVQMWEILQRPQPFTLVEMGAGQGILAADILHYLQSYYPNFFDALEYIIVEKAGALISQQQKILQNWKNIGWRTWDEIDNDSIIGCCFSNELVDALPIHQVVIKDRSLQEIYVASSLEEDTFIEVIDQLSTPKLAEYFNLVGIELHSTEYPDGYRTEINLAALDWLNKVADKLQQGYLLTIDYGYPAKRYYNPQRSQGTLQCYYRHQYHNDPYLNIGYQDITAHVDFTALEQQGKLSGLEKVGFTQQGLFLMALGMGDRIAALSSSSDNIQAVLQRRQALHQLIDPTGLGGFGVLIQSKGLSEEERTRSLKGLSMP